MCVCVCLLYMRAPNIHPSLHKLLSSRSGLGHLGHVFARWVAGSLDPAGPTGKRGAVCI